MKRFHCGDVVPGCQSAFTAESEDQILSAVAVHARQDHGMAEVPAELVTAVRRSIQDVAAA